MKSEISQKGRKVRQEKYLILSLLFCYVKEQSNGTMSSKINPQAMNTRLRSLRGGERVTAGGGVKPVNCGREGYWHFGGRQSMMTL